MGLLRITYVVGAPVGMETELFGLHIHVLSSCLRVPHVLVRHLVARVLGHACLRLSLKGSLPACLPPGLVCLLEMLKFLSPSRTVFLLQVLGTWAYV